MPTRLIEYDALWASDKLSACPEWAIPEYVWLYGLADANGSFELTNLKVIWGKVSAIRPHFTLSLLQECLDTFHKKGLLFVWENNGKRYGHWTGSTKPGRLPPPAHRSRFHRLAPQVPLDQLHQYEAGVVSSHALTNIQNGFGFGFGGVLVGLKDTAPAPPPTDLVYEGKVLTITEQDHRQFACTYPGVNLVTEYYDADAYLMTHPEKKYKNLRAFIRNWLSRESKSGRGVRAVDTGAHVGEGPRGIPKKKVVTQ